MFARRDFLCMLNFARLKRVFGKAKGNIFRRLCVYAVRILLHVLPIGFFSRLLAKNSKRYASKVTKRVGNFSGYSKAVCDREAFTSLIDVEFEGKTYKAPAGYDRWLRTVYGDYMQFPPLEERVGHNFIAAYLKDDSK